MTLLMGRGEELCFCQKYDTQHLWHKSVRVHHNFENNLNNQKDAGFSDFVSQSLLFFHLWWISRLATGTNLPYESIATVGEIRVYWRADFQSGSRVLKKVF